MYILGVYDNYEWDHCEECGYVAGTMSSQPRYVHTEVHDQESKVLVVMVARDGGHHHDCQVGSIGQAQEG